MTPARPSIHHIALLGLCLLHIAVLVWREAGPTLGIEGFLYPNGTPVGGDFINLWVAGRLVLEGQFGTIYRPEAFMAYQIDFIGAPIGYRVWAYPPHSLFLAMPFAWLDYYVALLIWSLIGLGVLAWGCRRLGLGPWEAAIVILSPASVLCVYYGQTGNLSAGFLLLALSARRGTDLTAIGAATLLTIKPQMGFLLPFFWVAARRWQAIIVTTALTLALAGLAWRLAGSSAWLDYLWRSLPELSLLERNGSGPFMSMVPSIFMALRILTGDGDLAIALHIVLAVPVVLFALWRLWRIEDALRRVGIVLAATVLASPYMHNYDLSLLVVAGLLLMRRFPAGAKGEAWIARLIILMLALPQLVVVFNILGVPVSPLLILPLLLLA